MHDGMSVSEKMMVTYTLTSLDVKKKAKLIEQIAYFHSYGYFNNKNLEKLLNPIVVTTLFGGAVFGSTLSEIDSRVMVEATKFIKAYNTPQAQVQVLVKKANECGINISKTITPQDLAQDSLFNYNLAEIAKTVEPETPEIPEIPEIPEEPSDSGEPEVDPIRELIGEDDPSEGEEETDPVEDLLDGEEPIEEAKETPEKVEETSENKENSEEKEASDFRIAREKYAESFGYFVDKRVESLLKTYNMIYSSGYEIMKPVGILTDKGIIKAKPNGTLEVVGNLGQAKLIYTGLNRVLNDSLSTVSQKYMVDINEVLNSQRPVYYPLIHLQAMFGYVSLCKKSFPGMHDSLYEMLHLEQSRVRDYHSFETWLRDRLEVNFYRAYFDYGVTFEVSDENIELINKLNNKIADSLKNVVAVTEQKKNVNLELRIGTNLAGVQPEAVLEKLNSLFNQGTDNDVKVNAAGEYKNGVMDMNIVFNEKAFSQSALFAHEVLSNLKEQGIHPAWDNVILGKSETGKIFTYNFKSDKKTTFGLYAASRSGKGVMTLNILAAALADKCKFLYIDGKPDMACTVGDIVWSKNPPNAGELAKQGNKFPDAPVFNGFDKIGPEKALENMLGCPREDATTESWDRMPNGVFASIKQKREFIKLVTYLRGIELLCAISEQRASQNLPQSDWLVCIIDECEQVSEKEAELDSNLQATQTELKKRMKTDEEAKKGFEFIQTYFQWKNRIRTDFVGCIKSTFGLAHVTTIFIWQSSLFPKKTESTSCIAKAVSSAAANIVKIVGKQAMQAYGSTEFGTPSGIAQAKVKWYDSRFTSDSSSGWFAIGSNVNSDKSMKVFRPFNVYSDEKGLDRILTELKSSGLRPDDVVGSQLEKLPDGSFRVMRGVGFENYINALMDGAPESPSDLLVQSFSYFDNAVREMDLGDGLLQFMFNAYDFGARGLGADASKEEIDAEKAGKKAEGFNLDDYNQKVDPSESEEPNEEPEEFINFGDPEPTGKRTPEEAEAARMARESFDILNRAQHVEQETPKEEPQNREGSSHILETFQRMTALSYNPLNRDMQSKDSIFSLCKDVGTLLRYKKNIFNSGELKGFLNDADKNFKKRVIQVYLGLVLQDESNIKRVLSEKKVLSILKEFEEPVDLGETKEPQNFGEPKETPQRVEEPIIEKPVRGEEPIGTGGEPIGTPIEMPHGREFTKTMENTGNMGFTAQNGNGSRGNNDSKVINFPNRGNEPVFTQTAPDIMNTKFDDADFPEDGEDYFDEFEERSKPSIERCEQRPSMTFDKNTGVYTITPRGNLTVNVMSNNFGFYMPDRGSLTSKFRGVLYSTNFGAQHIKKTECKDLLKEITAYVGRPDKVRSITVDYTSLLINKSILINLTSLLDDGYGTRLCDVLSLRMMLDRFRNCNQLMMIQEFTDVLYDEYGTQPQEIWNIFREHPALKTIAFQNGRAGIRVLNRETFRRDAEQAKLEMAQDKHRRDIEAIAASKATFSTLTKAQVARVRLYTNNGGSELFKKAGAHLGDKKIGRTVGYTALGLGVALGGFVFGLPGRVRGKHKIKAKA